eukprot:8154731-Alexandrium_andersonii.AAC.1
MGVAAAGSAAEVQARSAPSRVFAVAKRPRAHRLHLWLSTVALFCMDVGARSERVHHRALT